MKLLALAALIVACWLMAAPAEAQCVGGICRAPVARAVVVAPLRVVALPVRIVGRVVHRTRLRRAGRVERRVMRRMARRARW
jgi:hypothetical protein